MSGEEQDLQPGGQQDSEESARFYRELDGKAQADGAGLVSSMQDYEAARVGAFDAHDRVVEARKNLAGVQAAEVAQDAAVAAQGLEEHEPWHDRMSGNVVDEDRAREELRKAKRRESNTQYLKEMAELRQRRELRQQSERRAEQQEDQAA